MINLNKSAVTAAELLGNFLAVNGRVGGYGEMERNEGNDFLFYRRIVREVFESGLSARDKLIRLKLFKTKMAFALNRDSRKRVSEIFVEIISSLIDEIEEVIFQVDSFCYLTLLQAEKDMSNFYTITQAMMMWATDEKDLNIFFKKEGKEDEEYAQKKVQKLIKMITKRR